MELQETDSEFDDDAAYTSAATHSAVAVDAAMSGDLDVGGDNDAPSSAAYLDSQASPLLTPSSGASPSSGGKTTRRVRQYETRSGWTRGMPRMPPCSCARLSRRQHCLIAVLAAAMLAVLVLAAALLYGQYNTYSRTVILISLDGFRYEYFDRDATNNPAMHALAAGGVSTSAGMQPVFPSLTFPNHYSIVTGLYPESHGIVCNTMYDPLFNATFTLSNGAPTDGRWWGGEPLWVTAERQGLTAGTYFWPGSEAEIDGVRPTYYVPYDYDMPYDTRVSTIMQWLRKPKWSRPTFITLYLEMIDSNGHHYGVESDEVTEAIATVDATIASLLSQIADESAALSDAVNVIIVSDHGMTDLDESRTIFLDELPELDMSMMDVINYTPLLTVLPAEGVTTEQLYDELVGIHPNLTIYYREQLPERWHYQNNVRITDVVGVADLGWEVTTFAYYNSSTPYMGGHGYDNAETDMQAIFLANGRHFREGVQLDAISNLDVYNTVARMLHLEQAPNNGTDDDAFYDAFMVDV